LIIGTFLKKESCIDTSLPNEENGYGSVFMLAIEALVSEAGM
jgi:hypothetical protein